MSAGVNPPHDGCRRGQDDHRGWPDAGARRDRAQAGTGACARRRWGPCSASRAARPGGGFAQVVPMEDLNLHFTGDIHAVRCRQQPAGGDDRRVAAAWPIRATSTHCWHVGWRRAIDINDRALRQMVIGLFGGHAERLPARVGLRHHRCVRSDGDPRGCPRPARSSRPAWPDHRRIHLGQRRPP